MDCRFEVFFPQENWCYTPMNIYATPMLQLFYRDKPPDIEWGAIYNNWLAQLIGQRRARIGSRCGVTRYKTTLPLQRRIILGTGTNRRNCSKGAGPAGKQRKGDREEEKRKEPKEKRRRERAKEIYHILSTRVYPTRADATSRSELFLTI